MSYFNEKFSKKTYLIEFYSGETLVGAYGFSLPPQSEDFTFPQRIGETKTFGGSVFEDYGNDTNKIVLAGTTANNQVRIVNKGKFGQDYVNGEDEIFNLQKTIETYGKIENLDKKKVVLYDLSSKKHKYWYVVVNELNIKRSKDKPLSYDYTLTCTAYNNKKDRPKPAWYTEIVNSIEEMKEKLSTLQGWLSEYQEVIENIRDVRELLNLFESALLSYVNVISGFLDVTTEFIEESSGLATDIINSPGRILYNAESTLLTSAEDLNSSIVKVVDDIVNFEEKTIYPEIIERAQASATEIKESWIKISDDLKTESDKTVTELKRNSTQNRFAVNPGNSETDDELIQVYGFITSTVKDSDTWDSLALKYYGDASKSTLLAMYNIFNGSSLETGQIIKIPILEQSQAKNIQNEIFAPADLVDNYGIDIKIVDGKLTTVNGDLDIAKGIENLNQAISNRLSTEINSRIRVNTYGIKSTIGGIQEASSYIVSSIELTLLADPRVKSVDAIVFTGEGDNIYVNINYTDINGDKQYFGGSI